MEIKESLKKQRRDKGLTQQELADNIGVSLRTIQRYETGKRSATIEALQKIANALEISLSDLLGQTIPKEEQTMNEQTKTTDQEMKECFRQLFFKLSEASESDDCTANDLMTITQAMLSIYPMFRTLV